MCAVSIVYVLRVCSVDVWCEYVISYIHCEILKMVHLAKIANLAKLDLASVGRFTSLDTLVSLSILHTPLPVNSEILLLSGYKPYEGLISNKCYIVDTYDSYYITYI